MTYDEVWKSIPLFEERYRVSSHGRIMSVARTVAFGYDHLARVPVEDHILKCKIKNGQLRVSLYLTGAKDARYIGIARLVLSVFVCPPPFGKKSIAFCIDRNIENCRLDNLVWVPRSYLLAINTDRVPEKSLDYWVGLYHKEESMNLGQTP